MILHYSIREQSELFHLLFLQQLGQKLDKRLYAVKGGCNLRFFLGSIRYSEDIDIDVHTVAIATLRNNVNKILESLSFQSILKTHGMRISDTSMPKQTTTTQRWKIQLMISGQSLPIHTKIEFSRRQSKGEILTEAISRELIIHYKLRPIYSSHYSAKSALEQKILALILRTETQARDIFDIYHLLQTHHIKFESAFTKTELQTAKHNLLIIGYSEFKSQVVSYLAPADQEPYSDKNRWQDIVTSVQQFIEEQL